MQKKFFNPDIIFEYNGNGCVSQKIIEILNAVKDRYFLNQNLYLTESINKNFYYLGSIFGFNNSEKLIYPCGTKLFVSSDFFIFSYIPLTVEKNLGQIFRNIILEYFIQKSTKSSGFIYISDLAQKLNLHEIPESVKNILYFLSERPLSNENLFIEYQLLFTELFKKGFIGQKDIIILSKWSNYFSLYKI